MSHTRHLQVLERLVSITGEDPQAAVAVAVAERLARLENDRERRVQDLIRLGLHCAENLTGPVITSADIDTYLYDPHTGLPR